MSEITVDIEKQFEMLYIQQGLNKKIINCIFDDGLDIYDENTNMKLLGVPNLYCKMYFDDEDFIYARLKLTYGDISSSNISSSNKTKDIIDISKLCINDKTYNYLQTINQNINYLFHYVNIYYSDLKHFRPLERVYNLPGDYLQYLDSLVVNIKYMLDKDIFKYIENDIFTLEMFNELLYGLQLITCHIKMLCNHYCMHGKTLKNMEEQHIKKIMRLANNLCVVMIFLLNE